VIVGSSFKEAQQHEGPRKEERQSALDGRPGEFRQGKGKTSRKTRQHRFTEEAVIVAANPYQVSLGPLQKKKLLKEILFLREVSTSPKRELPSLQKERILFLSCLPLQSFFTSRRRPLRARSRKKSKKSWAAVRNVQKKDVGPNGGRPAEKKRSASI